MNKLGNHYNQMAYLLHCAECGFEYKANGCDVAIQKISKMYAIDEGKEVY